MGISGTIYFGALSRVLAPANEDFLSKKYNQTKFD